MPHFERASRSEASSDQPRLQMRAEAHGRLVVSLAVCQVAVGFAMAATNHAHAQTVGPQNQEQEPLANQEWRASPALQLEPRLATGLSYYEFEVDGQIQANNFVVDDVEFDDVLYVVGGGLTAKYEKMFLDVYGQASLAGSDDVDLDVRVDDQPLPTESQDVDFDRYEILVTLGYQWTDRFALFAGYKYADVEFDGNGTAAGVRAKLKTDFTQHGGFVGGGYAIPIGGIFNSALVFNGAVTFLAGDVDNRIVARPLVDNTSFDIDGDAIGFNGGVNWVAGIADNTKLVVGADASRYDFDADSGNPDFKETIARFRVELRYNFDTGIGRPG